MLYPYNIKGRPFMLYPYNIKGRPFAIFIVSQTDPAMQALSFFFWF